MQDANEWDRQGLVTAAVDLLKMRGPMSNALLAAALKGLRLKFDRTALTQSLEDPRIALLEDGRWAFVDTIDSGPTAPPNAEKETPSATLLGPVAAMQPDPEDLQESAPTRKPTLQTRWIRTVSGVHLFRVTDPATAGERALLDNLGWLGEGVAVLNVSLINGRQEREVDAIVISPKGVFTIEQKDTRLTGELRVPANGPATVGGAPVGDWRAQARKQAQVLATIAKREPDLEIGFINAVLAVRGAVTPVSDRGGSVQLCRLQDLRVLIEASLRAEKNSTLLSATRVSDLLARLELPPLSLEDLQSAGFGP